MRGMRCKSLSNFKMQMSLSISLFFLSLCGLSFVAISAPSCRRFRAVSPVGIYPNRASIIWFLINSLKMFARKLISPKPCRPTLSEIACVGVPRTECSFVCDFIALEIKESELASHHDNFCKFHVPYAWTSEACALETRRWFVTEQ